MKIGVVAITRGGKELAMKLGGVRAVISFNGEAHYGTIFNNNCYL
jgi:hypothetical protein